MPRQLTDQQCRKLFQAFAVNQRRCMGQSGEARQKRRCKTADRTLAAYQRHCRRILY